jgi:hypothetical protein
MGFGPVIIWSFNVLPTLPRWQASAVQQRVQPTNTLSEQRIGKAQKFLEQEKLYGHIINKLHPGYYSIHEGETHGQKTDQ